MTPTEIMVIIKNSGVIVTLAVTAINISFSIANQWKLKPHLRYIKNDVEDMVFYTPNSEMRISNADKVVFANIKLANDSNNSACIYEIQLTNKRTIIAKYLPTTHVLDYYKIFMTIDYDIYKRFPKSDFLSLPITIPPNGYAEGLVLLSVTPEHELTENTKIVVVTPKKTYKKPLVVEKISYFKVECAPIKFPS